MISLLSSRNAKGLLFAALVLLSLGLQVHHAFASSADITGDVSIAGTGNGGRAVTDNPDSFYAIWTNASNIDVTVRMTMTCSFPATSIIGSVELGGHSTNGSWDFPCANGTTHDMDIHVDTGAFPPDNCLYADRTNQFCAVIIRLSANTTGGHLTYNIGIPSGPGTLSYAGQRNSVLGTNPEGLNPPNGSPPTINDNWRPFGTFLAPNPTFHFTAPCDMSGTPNPVYVGWAGVDYPSSHQPAGVGFTITDDNNPGWPGISRNDGQLDSGNGDSSFHSTGSAGLFLIAGHHYTWTWHGLSGQNEIVYTLPFSQTSNLIPPCTSPVNWSLSGNSSVDVNGGPASPSVYVNSQKTPSGGDGPDYIHFHHSVQNSGPQTANYDWKIEGSYNGNSFDVTHCGDNGTGQHTIANNAGIGAGKQCPTQVSRLEYYNGESTASGSSTIDESETYQFPSNAVAGDKYCEHIVYTNATGPSTGSASSSQACAIFNPLSATCTNVTAKYSDNFYLRFVSASDGVYHQTGELGPGTVSLDPYSPTIFPTTPQLRPDLQYTVYIHKWDGTNNPDDFIGQPVSLGPCMAVGCVSPAVGIDMAGGEIEPGESSNASYNGVSVTNYTDQTFPGVYGVQGGANPGLSITGGSNPQYSSFTAGPSSGAGTTFAMGGTWTVRADSTGTMTGQLVYGGALGPSPGPLGGPCTSLSYTPQTRPYFSVKNGDVSAGGGFEHQTTDAFGHPIIAQCSISDGYPRFVSPWTAFVNNGSLAGNSDYFGGIRSFATNNFGEYNSSSDFAAYALGLIDQNVSDKKGFYSAASAGGGYNILSFANSGDAYFGPNNLGGVLGGSVGTSGDAPNIDAAAHCAPDYFDQTVSNPTAGFTSYAPTSQITVGDGGTYSASGQYKVSVSGGCVNLAGTPAGIHGGVSMTIYVQGDVCINGSVNYGSWSFGTFNSVPNTNDAPYFALVVQGNIYVQPSASEMDLNGFYVVQPTTSDPANTGRFATCSNAGSIPATGAVGNPDAPAASVDEGDTDSAGHSVVGNCTNDGQLIIKGAVVAQHVYLLRTFGSLSADSAEGHSPAEVFNFSPSVIVGQPNFKPEAGSDLPNQLQDVSGLPPIF